MAKKKNKRKSKRRSTSKVFEAELDQKLKDIKRHALVIAIQNKPETRLLDVVELASRLGLGKDITIGDLQAGASKPIAGHEPLALPESKVSGRKRLPRVARKPSDDGKLGGDERKKVKAKIVRMIAKQKEPISARDLRFALDHPKVDSPRMTELLRELVDSHQIAYEGVRSKRVYYALK